MVLSKNETDLSLTLGLSVNISVRPVKAPEQHLSGVLFQRSRMNFSLNIY